MADNHPIDKLFRDGLNDPGIPFNENDWKAVSGKLGKRKTRLPLFAWIGSGIAASVILAALFFSNQTNFEGNDRQRDSTTPRGQTQRERPQPGTDGHNPDARAANAPRKAASSEAAAWADAQANDVQAAVRPNAPVMPTMPLKPSVSTALTQGRPRAKAVLTTGMVQPAEQPGGNHLRSRRPGWSLGIMAAPDVSGTQPFSGKLSSNIGILATSRFTDRWSISVGALYAKKFYRAGFDHYRPASGWPSYGTLPEWVDADCRVIDIPLTVNYTWRQRPQSSWFLSAGLSSYVMLSETYLFRYAGYGDTYQYRIENENRHPLGIGNLSVGYRRQLSPTLSVTVQPFVKVPLTGIGNGNLKLYSTGVTLSADVDLSRKNR